MPKPETITSAANPLLKDVRRAIARGGLTEDGWCVAESFHLLEEALRSDCAVKMVLAGESVLSAAEAHVRRLAGIKIIMVPDALMQSISGTENSQGVMALVQPREWKLEQLFRGCPLVVVLDGLQDPGNAGAILRAAEAFGATGALFLKGTVSPFNPKTLRASAGSLFRVPFLTGMDAALAPAALQQHQVTLYAAVPAGAGGKVHTLAETDLRAKCGLIIGNEARGVSSVLRGAALDLSIPTVGVESLNAAVAAGIILYEARRQRSLPQ
ncbi:MAG TPA: RNA methyltransferase [Candidatus Sulfopaludibacter sp.]|jgi:TrmH family RNA methyltransferase|nr:RNA methyltransferase [Candidatus Sulfopaludibacter sp.]